MNDATIEFLQFIAVLFLLPYVLGGAISVVLAPFVFAWFTARRIIAAVRE